MTSTPKPIEVEIKFEVTEEKFKETLSTLLQQGFKIIFEGVINDVYSKIEESPLGGNDFTRYRIEESTGNVTETIKTWEKTDIPGQDKRTEIERTLTYDEYKNLETPELVSLRKHRTSLSGNSNSVDIHIDFDRFFVPEGFSPVHRYFVEVEKIEFEESKIANTRKFLSDFASHALDLTEECRLSMLKLAKSYQK